MDKYIAKRLFPEEKQQTQGQIVFQGMSQDLQGELYFRRDFPHRNIEPIGNLRVGQTLDAARKKYFASAHRHLVELRLKNIQYLITEQLVEQIVVGQRLDR